MSKWKWQTETMGFDATDAGRVFDRLIREFGSPKEVNRIAGMTVLEAMQVAFDRGVDPGTGIPWPELRPNTIASKGHGIPLVRTKRLRESLRKGRPGNVFLISKKRAKVGSRLKHAAFAQEGTRPHTIAARRKKTLAFMTTGGMRFPVRVNHPGTPPRPIVGVTPSTLGEIDRRIGRYLDALQISAGGKR